MPPSDPEDTPSFPFAREVVARLHDAVDAWLTTLDPAATRREDRWQRPDEAGHGITRVWEGGAVIAKAGAGYSLVHGKTLPPAASALRPELAGQPFRVVGVSVIVHPVNPHAPTTHMNIRYFQAGRPDDPDPVWWFGGGFDLTPIYGYEEDAVAWHEAAAAVCAPFGPELYDRGKVAADRYFYLRHRDEYRGIGGLFFDDFNELGFTRSRSFFGALGNAYIPVTDAIVRRRMETPYTPEQVHWQQLRRGRYVEFNLLYDRGTLFGLQSQGRTQSILMSLPPQVAYAYDDTPAPGSDEERLLRDFLQPRDWLGREADTPSA